MDRPALLTIRDIIEEMEPLAAPEVDDYLHPSTLKLRSMMGCVRLTRQKPRSSGRQRMNTSFGLVST